MVHIYRALEQPATDFFDDLGGELMGFVNPGHRCLWSHCCHRKRWAENLIVKIYYDAVYICCAEGYGCKKRMR